MVYGRGVAVELERTWTIGELAQAAGVTTRTLRHYDEQGLLEPVERSDGGHRRYGETELLRLRRILILRELGFSLPAIDRLLGAGNRTALLEMTKRQLARVQLELEIGDRLRDRLEHFRKVLEQSQSELADDAIDEMEESKMATLDQIYTRLGDAGETHLGDMSRVPKTDALIEAGGALDELGAALGLASATSKPAMPYRSWLARIENDLMDIAGDLSVPPDSSQATPRIDPGYVRWLERACDEAKEKLQDLDSFIVWFGEPAAAQLNLCRTVCRRAERRVLAVDGVNPEIVRYLNRLSDLLFILARVTAAGQETCWRPGGGAELA
jgi:cob(I)alamin adenosyltransferase